MLSKYSITSVRPFNAANIRDVLPARKRESKKKYVSTCFFVNENKKAKKTNDKIVRYEKKGSSSKQQPPLPIVIHRLTFGMVSAFMKDFDIIKNLPVLSSFAFNSKGILSIQLTGYKTTRKRRNDIIWCMMRRTTKKRGGREKRAPSVEKK